MSSHQLSQCQIPTREMVEANLRERVAKLEAALLECAKHAGGDVREGRPIEVWAVDSVNALAEDYDLALDMLEEDGS